MSWSIVTLLLVSLVLRGPAPVRRPAAVTFVDATAPSGLKFQHRNSATASKYLIETMAGGVALLDYDGDGWLDVFFTNGAKLKEPQPDNEPPDKTAPEFWNRLFRNNRDGTFRDATARAGLQGRGYGMGVAVADYDNDGAADLFVTGYGESALYRNNGDGTFAEATARAGIKTDGWMTSAGFFDFNNDSHLDLFVCRYLDWNFARGSLFCGERRARGYCHPDKFEPVANYLFKNNGDGTFADVSAASGIKKHPGKALGVAFADYNDDGLVDISVANDSFPQYLFRNNGDGTFAEVGAIAGVGYTEDGETFAGMGTDFADVDDDGRPDIVTTALPYEYYAYFRNDGGGSFRYLSLDSGLGEITRPFGGWGVRIFDYDNDGHTDLFLANGHVMDNIERTQPHLAYRQRPLLLKFAGGKFTDASPAAGEIFKQPMSARGAAFGDLDNDGDMDAVVANCDSTARLFRNEGGDKNHWIGLKLRGTRSNRDGAGAEVTLVRKDNRPSRRFASTAAGYLSAQDARIFFGLGDHDAVKRITVRWPSGRVQEINKPPVNQVLEVVEK